MDELYRDNPNAITLGPGKKHCMACANVLDARAELCPRCGVRQPTMALVGRPPPGPTGIVRPRKDKVTAGILAIFLGGLGIHRFYLGQTGIGIVYLLLCWTCVPSFIAFIEGIIFLTMSEQSFAQRYQG